MKIGFSHLILLALLGGATYLGVRAEAARIQDTCEDDRGRTVINGTEYLCLSSRQIRQLQMQARPGRSA